MPLDAMNDDAHDPFAKFNTDASPILFPVATRKIAWRTRNDGWEEFNTHKAIIRPTPDGKAGFVLGVVGDGYKLVHNKELFKHVEDTMCKEIPRECLHGVRVTDRVSSWGRTCFREYIFPNIKCVLKANVKSEIAFRLIAQNGYGGSALRFHAGAIDFYCTNGMIRGEYQTAYRKHTKGIDISGFSSTVRRSLEQFTDSQAMWNRWASTPVKPQTAMELFRELASSDKLCANLSDQYMREREDRGDNLWAVYSTMTYYASHATDDAFRLRKTVVEADSVATTMLKRELDVARWVESDEWKQLEEVS